MVITLPFPPTSLSGLLDYNPETGVLIWKNRSPVMFTKAAKPEEICRAWNTRHAGKVAFTNIRNGYLRGAIFGVRCCAHRAAWAVYYGEWPIHQIDHINGDKTDNRIANLRDVDHQTNCKNKRISKKNKSGFNGVIWDVETGKWAARITIDGKLKRLGRYKDKADAIIARQEANALCGYHENHGASR